MNRSRWIARAAVTLVALVMGLALAGCSVEPGNVSNAQFEKLRESGVRILDVRTAAEFAGGYIEGAENVPISEVETAVAGWDPAEPIALYCATGDRSAAVMEYLNSLGFEKVYNLTAGIAAWDGPRAGGATGTAGGGGEPSVSGLPVMYEFYTDW
jgi:rhodanese-related sulfurtransferase